MRENQLPTTPTHFRTRRTHRDGKTRCCSIPFFFRPFAWRLRALHNDVIGLAY